MPKIKNKNILPEEPLWRQWIRHWKDPQIQRNALYTSGFVGTILLAINQGNHLLQGHFSTELALKTVLTFMVPYLVASVSAVRSQIRLKPDHLAPRDGYYRCEACLREGTVHDIFIEEGDPIPFCEHQSGETLFTFVEEK